MKSKAEIALKGQKKIEHKEKKMFSQITPSK